MREAAREAKNSYWTGRKYVREAGEEKKKMGERATQAASKSAKDGDISTEEAADLVEESRDSALAEGQKKVNNRQIIVFLIIIIFIIWITTVDPNELVEGVRREMEPMYGYPEATTPGTVEYHKEKEYLREGIPLSTADARYLEEAGDSTDRSYAL